MRQGRIEAMRRGDAILPWQRGSAAGEPGRPTEPEGADERVNRKTESQTEMQGRFVGEPGEPDTADLEIPMLTTAEVARTLNVSQPTVRRLIKREGLPAIKLQRRYRIPRGLFEDWVKERAVGVQEGDE